MGNGGGGGEGGEGKEGERNEIKEFTSCSIGLAIYLLTHVLLPLLFLISAFAVRLEVFR